MIEFEGDRTLAEDALVACAYAACGNAFVLIDGLRGPLPKRPPELARRLSNFESNDCPGFRPDGLLLMTPTTDETAFGMVLYNLDGSRPEACGNGLRCLAHHALASGLLMPGSHAVTTDAGLRRIRIARADQGRFDVAALAAHPRILDEDAPAACPFELRAAVHVDCGNPHLVLFVQDESKIDLDPLGRAVQHDERFPKGVNVEVVRVGPQELSARVFERGVGETGSCGTGACAVACAARAVGFVHGERAEVRFPGGLLQVDLDEGGGAWLSGAVECVSSALGGFW